MLAAVAAGLLVSRQVPQVISSASNLVMDAVWNVLTFLLNGLAFILIGLQLPEITDGLGGYAVAELAWSAAMVSLAVVLVRFAWVFPASYLPHLLYRGPRELDPYPSWRNVLVVSWAGMRGVISLAAALALPQTAAGGAPFPGRDLILFLTFCVILATLVVQGLSLPLLIRTLGLADDGLAEREEMRARLEAAEAALTRLGGLRQVVWRELERSGSGRQRPAVSHVLKQSREPADSKN